MAYSYVTPVSILTAAGDELLDSGSASLVRIAGCVYALTARHVLVDPPTEFGGPDAIAFKFGDVFIPAAKSPAFLSSTADLGLVELTDEQADQIGRAVSELDAAQACEAPPAPGTSVLVTGFPGSRRSVSETQIDHAAVTGSFPVSESGDLHAVCQLDRSGWITVRGSGALPEGESWGGMSGGPVFSVRDLHYPLVGVLSESEFMFESVELLRISLLRGLSDFGPLARR